VGALLGYYALLRQRTDGVFWVQLVLGCTWAADTGAYLVGRRWGRTPLAPKLSPSKSVEGAFGALAVSTALALVVALLAPAPGRSVPLLLGLGLLVGAAGITGDLVESWIKRQLGAKDASSLLLGHGGLLDRMDSLLATGMVAYYYLATLGG
jgi:phosphatidate cytidylyltransferase